MRVKTALQQSADDFERICTDDKDFVAKVKAMYSDADLTRESIKREMDAHYAELREYVRAEVAKMPKRVKSSFYYGAGWGPAAYKSMVAAKGICQRCKKARAVVIHHVLPVRFFKYLSEAHFQENLKPVCRPCHLLEHEELKRDLPLLNLIQFPPRPRKSTVLPE
jgi:5-methylcytosine-specific restriction endonuclease McrA